MNSIDGKTLEEILNPQEKNMQCCDASDDNACYDRSFEKANFGSVSTPHSPATDLANSLAENMTSNLLFLSILAGNKIKL